MKAERREQRKTDEPGDLGGPPIIADDPADFGPTKE